VRKHEAAHPIPTIPTPRPGNRSLAIGCRLDRHVGGDAEGHTAPASIAITIIAIPAITTISDNRGTAAQENDR
jgi:hypothetical protein